MTQARRRVSYIIPPPTEPAPRLQLPPHGASRLGATEPLLKSYDGHPEPRAQQGSKWPKYPRHRLGVASLALDTSIQLVGRPSPEGILYSGGRDGLVMSWDLGLPMKRRRIRDEAASPFKGGKWEVMTGWDDDSIDEELEDGDYHFVSDGDILGDVTANIGRRRQRETGEGPYEQRWETDLTNFQPGISSRFRQSAQAHTDWVNDILLCNYNQTVVSASSDGTIKTWNPHSPIATDPTTLGSHSDYVRCLALCREQNWVASGSFDRTIKLWDLSCASSDPLVTLNPPESVGSKSSIYALAVNPYGHTIASGSPERVIRLWDPRTAKRTGKLVGHTDNIRAILISDDSKYLLTGSADASIKLWSLASQRCLHTFTHHTDSVWSLFSAHPSLEVFYSGDRSGLVCRIDVEDCTDVSDGECVLLCNDSSEATRPSSEGINKIVVMDDNLLWAASGTSTITRWDIPQKRSSRMSPFARLANSDPDGERLPSASTFGRRLTVVGETASESSTRPSSGQGHRDLSFAPSMQSLASEQWRERDETKLNGLPYDSLIKLVSPNDPFTSFSSSRTRDPEVATLYSAASVMSVPRQAGRAPLQNIPQSTSATTPLQSSRTEDTVLASTARHHYEEREWAADALPLCTEPESIIQGDHGLVRSVILNDRVRVLTVDTAGEVAVWDIIRGECLGRYVPEDVAMASHGGSSAGGSGDCERSPRESLEAVRERIEGEAVVSTWCTADTKAGVLTIHLAERCFEAEVYADEVGFSQDHRFNDESKLNLGKWILRNLFLGFILEEQRIHPANEHEEKLSPTVSRVSSQDALNPKLRNKSSTPKRSTRQPLTSSSVVYSATLTPPILPNVTAHVPPSPLLTPLIPLYPQVRENLTIMPVIPQSPLPNIDTTPVAAHGRTRSGTVESSGSPPSDYFSVQRARQQSLQSGMPASPEDFSGGAGPNKHEPPTPSTPGGLMSKLKNFGKAKRPVSEASNSSVVEVASPTAEAPAPEPPVEIPKTPVQLLLAGVLTPPTSVDGPSHPLPANTTVLISEEGSLSYTTVYRGNAASIQYEVEKLEEAMPLWLAQYLLLNQVPQTTMAVKVSFVLMPWNKDPDVEPLPELLNTTQSKLTASRYLRIRKVVNHVQDKLERLIAGSQAAPIQPSAEGQEPKPFRPKAEDVYEILCNDTLLPLHMTLAAVRQYVWKQSAELILHYRRKYPPQLLPPRLRQ